MNMMEKVAGDSAFRDGGHPTSESFGAWAEFYIGPLAGFLIRYAYWSSLVLGIDTEVTAIAVYMSYWYPQELTRRNVLIGLPLECRYPHRWAGASRARSRTRAARWWSSRRASGD